MTPEPFKDPGLTKPTPLRIDGDVVWGHFCCWETMHTGARVRAAETRTDGAYRYFHLGGYKWQGKDIDVGSLTLRTVHADIRLNGPDAIRHYEDTGAVAAYVRAGDDAHGGWFCGRLRKGISEEDIEALRGAKVSGDWRGYQGRRELIGMLAVNTPGFPVQRERVLVAGGLSLVASGVVEQDYDPRSRLKRHVLARRLRLATLAKR